MIFAGGKLIFDDGKDIELQAEYILILNGGLLQVIMYHIIWFPQHTKAIIVYYYEEGFFI